MSRTKRPLLKKQQLSARLLFTTLSVEFVNFFSFFFFEIAESISQKIWLQHYFSSYLLQIYLLILLCQVRTQITYILLILCNTYLYSQTFLFVFILVIISFYLFIYLSIYSLTYLFEREQAREREHEPGRDNRLIAEQGIQCRA